MENVLSHSVIERVAQVRDETMQQYFLKQMTDKYPGEGCWKAEVARKVGYHFQRDGDHRETYRRVHFEVIRARGAQRLKITDLDISILYALILFDFRSDFEIDENYRNYIERIRIARNTRQHFADHGDILQTRADAAITLTGLRDFLRYLKTTPWNHPDVEAFTDEYLARIDIVDAELFNDKTRARAGYKALPFDQLQKMVENDIPEAQLEMAARLYWGTADEGEYDNHQARELFQKAAAAGNAEAKAWLAYTMLRKRTATKAEIKEAFDLLAKAEEDSPFAHFVYGEIALDGLGGEEKNRAVAYKEFKKGAELGCAEAKLYQVYCEATEDGDGRLSMVNLARIENVATEINNGYAYNFAGWCYAKSSQYEEAVGFYKKAAEMGYVVAEKNLGSCYLNGQGVAEDPEEAFSWYEKAAQKGYVPARYQLAGLYYDGTGIDQDQSTAFRMFMDLLKEGYAPAKVALAECFYFGNGTLKNEGNAFILAKAAAEESDHSIANYILGMCYYHGRVAQKDPKEAVNCFERAAKADHADANYMLGRCYAEGIVKKDPALAYQYYQRAADLGSAGGAYQVGYCYHKGIGTDKVPSLAFEYFKRAADKGHALAAHAVAEYYRVGYGVGKNEDQAFAYYKQAADKGYAAAQYQLGCCYEAAQNMDKAIRYYQAAADKKNTDAEYALGRWYYAEGNDARSVSFSAMQDESFREEQAEKSKRYYCMSIKYLKRAAEKEHRAAQYTLAECYRRGCGVEENAGAAYALYEKVALSKDSFAHDAKQAIIADAAIKSRIVEDICIRNKWFAELTEEYLRCMNAPYAGEKEYNRAAAWLNRAKAAGYADAAEKKRALEEAHEQNRRKASLWNMTQNIKIVYPDD